jgi:hypothetical protein
MKPALTTLFFIALAASSSAWDHPLDPLEKVVVRFKEQHPQHCKEKWWTKSCNDFPDRPERVTK